jgi:tetratricopeptide (TPR) repeat protein
MKNSRTIGIGLVCFALGGAVTGLAQKKNDKPTFSNDMIQRKDPKEAATALLDGALTLAGSGSWERIAVGRAWYLGGDKAKGQQIIDGVTSGKKVEASDWYRIARVYNEANEWDKAIVAFDKALAADPGDDTGTIEYGGWANVHKDRLKAEALFSKIMTTKKGGEFWHWVNAGGSYLGVGPQ